VLAALATLVASAYIHLLIAAVNISAMMGYGLVDTMRTAGASMLLDFARMGVSKADMVWAVLGTVLAAFTAMRTPAAAVRKTG
jgi:vitamin B12 transport system permease protein